MKVLAFGVLSVSAEDWPQWLGPQRDGVWRENGIVGQEIVCVSLAKER